MHNGWDREHNATAGRHVRRHCRAVHGKIWRERIFRRMSRQLTPEQAAARDAIAQQLRVRAASTAPHQSIYLRFYREISSSRAQSGS